TLDISNVDVIGETVNATLVASLGLAFQGLTDGPPDVEPNAAGVGKYADDLFTTAGGKLYAIDMDPKSAGYLQFADIFNAGTPAAPVYATSIPLGVSNVEDLAFSTLDYNLWHVTQNRSSDPGHNINVAPDNSRNPLSANKPPQNGGDSYYFGLEDPAQKSTISTQPGAANYITNPSIAQGWKNEAGGGTYTPDYNTPGGAYGVLTTNSFSLANYSAADKPTVYFNYYLNTEDASSTSSTKLQTMFDSARVEVSEDGGFTWNLLASNNPFVATYPGNEAEQPYYQSTNAETGSADSGLGNLQVVQPLFDSATTNTGWRQARIDLSDYAGQNNLQFRFDFSTAGTTFNPADLQINAVTGEPNMVPGEPNPYANRNVYGNQFGQFNGANNNGGGPEHRGINNDHEGWYIDDIVVGFAERGEMVTGVVGGAAAGNSQHFAVPIDPVPGTVQPNVTGQYQLEIRRGTEYGAGVDKIKPDIALGQSFDTNDRFADAYSLIASAGSGLSAGETFTLNDGQHSVTFEFVAQTFPAINPGAPLADGNLAIPFSPFDLAQTVADTMVAAIDGSTTLVGVSAADIQNGFQGVSDPTTNIVNLFGVVEVSSSTASYNRLMVTAAGTSITESGPTSSTTITVSREGSVKNPQTVTLSALDVDNPYAPLNSPSGNVTFTGVGGDLVGNNLTFPAGQSSVQVTVSGVKKTLPSALAGLFPNDELADGTQTVEIVATDPSGGLSSVGGTIDVTDDPGVYPKLAVTLASLTAPQDSTTPISGTVYINTGPLNPNVYPNGLTVKLQSLDPGAATVTPATHTIWADGSTVSFPITVTPADDGVSGHPGGLQDAVILATAAGFASGSATLAVTDDTSEPPGSPPDQPFGGTTWVPQGPAPITGAQSQTVGGNDQAVGAIENVLPDPNNASIVYAGAVNGGIWKTTDYNSAAPGTQPTWTPLTDNLPQVTVGGNLRYPSNSIGALQFAVDDTNPSSPVTEDGIASPNDIIIAGIGRFSSFDFTGGFLGGLIRSTDGGQTGTANGTANDWTVISPANLQGLNITGVSERDDYSTGMATIVVGADMFAGSPGGLYSATVPIGSLSHPGSVVTPLFTPVYENQSLPPLANTAAIPAPTGLTATPSATSGFLSGPTYYYEVTALTAAGESTASAQVTAAVTGPTGEVALSWNSVAGAIGYNIYRGTTSGGENVLAFAVEGGGTTTYTDTGVPTASPSLANTATISAPILGEPTVSSGGTFAANTYYYVVTALTGSGQETTVSNEEPVTVAAGSGVQLNWTTVAGATRYSVYRGTSAGSESVLVKNTTGTSLFDSGYPGTPATLPAGNTAVIPAPTMNTPAGLTSGGSLAAGTYWYAVTAITASGETTAPTVDESATVASGSSGEVIVVWNSVNGAIGYRIYRGPAGGVSGGENTLVGIVDGSTTFYFDRGVPSGVMAATPPIANGAVITTPVQDEPVPATSGGALTAGAYYYEVTALTALGETPAGNEESVVVPSTGEVTLSWKPVAGATAYKIYRGTAAGGEDVLVATQTAVGLGEQTVVDKGSAPALIPFGSVTDLVADPGDPNRLYVGSIDNATAPTNNGGIFTTDDDGRNWTNITPAALTMLTTGNNIYDNVRIAVSSGTDALYFGYVKTGVVSGALGGQLNALYRTPGPDFTTDPATWTPNQAGPPPTTTWVQMDTPTTDEGGVPIGIEPDGAEGKFPGGQGYVHFSIVADPTNPNLVYVGGDRQPGPGEGGIFNWPNSVGATNYTGRLFRGDASQPTGSQWTPITNDATAGDTGPHADSRHMAFDDGGNLLEVDDGGIYALTNPSITSPTDKAGDWYYQGGNLQVSESHNVAYDTLTGTLLAGNQDTGTPEQTTPATPGNLVWTENLQGDGGDVAVDNSSPTQSIRYTSADLSTNMFGYYDDLTASTYNAAGTLIGQTFPSLYVPASNKYLGQLDNFPFVVPIVLDAVDPTRMVIPGLDFVWESMSTPTDPNGGGGNDFAQVFTSTFTFPLTNNFLTGAPVAYGGMLNGVPNPDVLWVGSQAQVLLRTSSGGFLNATNYAGGTVTALAINPNDWQEAVVTDANSQVWLTTNAGATFTNITLAAGTRLTQLTANLFSAVFAPAAAGAADAPLGGTLYIGSQDGVYALSLNGAGSPTLPGWTRYAIGMPDVPVYSLKYVPGKNLLIAGTMGRGTFIASAVGDLTVSVTPLTGATPLTDDAGIVPDELRISRDGPTVGDLTVTLTSSDPTTATVPSTVVIPDGQAFVDVPVTVLDDPLAKYPTTVVFTATGGNLNPVSAAVDIEPQVIPPFTNTAGIAAPTGVTATPQNVVGGTLTTGNYVYTVTSLSASGESTVGTETPAAVIAGDNAVGLTWNSMPGATGYNIYRGTSPG
ncbi:MAG TPA: hypothetical protein PK867_04680, partial [Pirellulales bacterium]|nr:hypothetical protein [Pirellulales bacterium]